MVISYFQSNFLTLAQPQHLINYHKKLQCHYQIISIKSNGKNNNIIILLFSTLIDPHIL